MSIRIVESRVVPRSPGTACEDVLFEGDDFVAVIDGATSKPPPLRGATTPGRAIALRLASALERLERASTARQAMSFLADDVRAWVGGGHAPAGDAPSASLAVFSAARSEVWCLGDCLVTVGDTPWETGRRLDEAAADFRAAVLSVALASGRTVDELRADDIGREAILPLLSRQSALRNDRAAGPFAYGAMDGDPRCLDFLRTFVVTPGEGVILATDGYPDACDSLDEAEGHLAHILLHDPLMMWMHRSTKGMAPGASSYDDRAYVRIATSP